MMPRKQPKDPIYRESAMALEGLSPQERVSWVATLIDIMALPTTPEDRLR